ncbi:MAG: hypothetical protein OHK93_000199 [Ramalina farinacea]|uniref:CHAT domain-containing protein n=1 Tax=Ramalina farinacea TaxID=258253 RepID=A0AA43QEE6_9LECA|nr:hypothetical protein [Ramalina farinacea]
MDFKDVCEFFGGSIFPEEPRCDYPDIVQRLNDVERSLSSTSDTAIEEGRAALLLLRVVHLVLTGKHKKAHELINELSRCTVDHGLPDRWRFRAGAYALLNTIHILFPPLGRSHTVAHGPSSLLVEDRFFSPQEEDHALKNILKAGESMRNAMGPLDQLEFDLFVCMYIVSKAMHDIPASDIGRSNYVVAPSDMPSNVSISIGGRNLRIRDVAAMADTQGLPIVSRNVDRLSLEFDGARKWDLFAEGIKQLYERYTAASDEVGEASLIMMIGDNIVSEPRTSPLSLNMVLHEQHYQSQQRGSWEPPQAPLLPESFPAQLGFDTRQSEPAIHNLIDTPFKIQNGVIRQDTKPVLVGINQMHTAFDLYTRAEQIYLAHGIHRGAALAQLRKFCLLHMHTLHPGYMFGEVDTFHETIAKLLRTLHNTLHHCGDPMLEMVCNLHLKIWKVKFRVAGNSWTDGWAQENLTFVLTRSLGLLAHQVGLYYRYTCGYYRFSVRCLQLAHSIFQVAPADAGAAPGPLTSCFFDAVESLVDTLASFGRFSDAQVQVDLLQSVLPRLCQQFERAGMVMLFRKVICREMKFLFQKRVLQRVLTMFARTAATSEFSSKSRMDFLVTRVLESAESQEESDWAAAQVEYLDFLFSDKLSQDSTVSTRPGIDMEESFQFLDLNDPQVRIETALKLIEKWTRLENGEKTEMICAGVLTSLVTDCLSSAEVQGANELEAFLEDRGLIKRSSSSWRVALSCSEECLELCVRAKLWTLAKTWLERLELLAPGFSTGIHCPTRFWPWQRRLWLGLIHEAEGDYHSAMQAYIESSILALDDYPVDNDIEEQRSQFNIPDMGRISTSIARMYLLLGEASSAVPDFNGIFLGEYNVLSQSNHSEYAKFCALTILERRKAQYITELLAIDRSDVAADKKAKWLLNYRDWKLYIELRSLGSLRTLSEEEEFDGLRPRVKSLSIEVINDSEVVSAAREISRGLNIKLMQDALRGNTVVVFTCLSEDGLGLFCFNATDMLHTSWNPSACQAFISRKVRTYLAIMNEQKLEAKSEDLLAISHALSNVIVKPIEAVLRMYEHIVFVPSGDMAQFPLNALVLDEEYLAYSKYISQVPNMAFYHYHSQSKHGTKVKKFTAMAKPGTLAEEVLEGGEVRLPMGGIEALIASAIFDESPINAADMTRQDFRDELQESNFVHICTHGYLRMGRPSTSYLSLKERLRVVDLTGVKSSAKAVIFSACLSGSGWSYSSDDIAGFSHAVLATGVDVFAGCLWQVNELTTLLHMVIFYSGFRLVHLAQGNSFLFLQLWTWATRLLAGLDIGGARKLLRAIVDLWDRAASRGRAPERFVKRGKKRLLDAIEDLTNDAGEPLVDFSHPYVWAPFSVLGFAEFCMQVKTGNEEAAEQQHRHVELDRYGLDNLLEAVLSYD